MAKYLFTAEEAGGNMQKIAENPNDSTNDLEYPLKKK